MTLLEIMEKQREEQKIREVALSQKITTEEASWRYYKKRIFNTVFETPQFYNMKHVKYLNHEEYRLFKIPFQTGNKRTSAHVEYEEIGGKEYNKATKKERTKESKQHSEQSSLSRTKQKIYNYAFSNDWSKGLFFTITFDPEQVDSFDYDKCYKRLHQFLKNIKDQNPDFKYIFVPEFHKSGRIHFHGIGVNCDKLKLEDSGIKKNGKKIYNICSKTFKYGFTTVSKIADTQKVSSYITKYITKEMITATKGKHRYLCSRNLDTAEVENIMVNDKELFMKSVECNPNVINQKTFKSEETGQEITYIKVKK